MQLSNLRAQFISLTGRNDLSLTMPSGSDFATRADYFINNASDWLDENVEIDRQTKHYSIDVTAGNARVLIPNPMDIECVYAQESNTEGWELEEKDYRWVRHNYREIVSSISNSSPAYWCYGLTDLMDDQVALTSANYTSSYTYEFGDTLFADESTPGSVGRYRVRSMLVLPPVDKTYTITFVGKFYSKFLSLDADENMWSSRRPQLLIKVSQMMLEGGYRNFEGVQDWAAFIDLSELQGIRKAQSDKEVTDNMQMEG